jgi:hypothetical protein
MHLRFAIGIFRSISSYAINDFESLTVGPITDLPGGVSIGGVRFETATFTKR